MGFFDARRLDHAGRVADGRRGVVPADGMAVCRHHPRGGGAGGGVLSASGADAERGHQAGPGGDPLHSSGADRVSGATHAARDHDPAGVACRVSGTGTWRHGAGSRADLGSAGPSPGRGGELARNGIERPPWTAGDQTTGSRLGRSRQLDRRARCSGRGRGEDRHRRRDRLLHLSVWRPPSQVCGDIFSAGTAAHGDIVEHGS